MKLSFLLITVSLGVCFSARTRSNSSTSTGGAGRPTQRPSGRTTAEPAAQPGACCGTALYPEGKVWIQMDGSKMSYTFYDPYGIVDRMTVSNIDANGNVATTKLVDGDAQSLSCPPNYRPTNPKHTDLTKNQHFKLFCVNKENKMVKGKWYAVCRDRGCISCHLNRAEITDPDPEYVKVKSTKIQGNSMVLQFSVEPAGVNYNVSLEVGNSRDNLAEFTISPAQRTYTLQIPNVPETVYRNPVYLFVDPWVKSPAGCPVMGQKQVSVMEPMRKPKQL